MPTTQDAALLAVHLHQDTCSQIHWQVGKRCMHLKTTMNLTDSLSFPEVHLYAPTCILPLIVRNFWHRILLRVYASRGHLLSLRMFTCIPTVCFYTSPILILVVYYGKYRIAGIFRGVKFSWFSWLRGEPRNLPPTKQYRIVPGCGLVYGDHEKFSTNWPKIHWSRKFYPPKNTRYTVLSTLSISLCTRYTYEV